MRASLVTAIVASVVNISIPAPARSAESASPESSRTDLENAPTASGLEEIVVTARRREERLQDVPAAVSALTGDDLRDRNVETSVDLQNFVPSLNLSSTFSRDENAFVIRGMGPTNGSQFVGGGTGVVAYFSEVPANGSGPGLFYDLENVQVIKGPQGTLFGKNTTGGVVLFTPRKPANDFGGYVDVSAGNYDMFAATAALNVPIVADKLLIRVAGQMQRRDGFTIDRGPLFPGKDYDDRDYRALRLSVLFRPTERIENHLVVSDFYSDTNGDGFVLSAANPEHSLSPLLLPVLADQEASGIRSTAFSTDTRETRHYYGAVNTTRVELSDNVTLKNIFGYQVRKVRNADDVDATIIPILDLPGAQAPDWAVTRETYTEEVQLQGSALSDNLKWTTGAYYEHGASFDDQPFEVHVFDLVIVQPKLTNSDSSKGLYAQTVYDLGGLAEGLHGLKLTTGYRYTWDTFFEGIALYSPTFGNTCFTSAGVYPQADCVFAASGKSEAESWTVGLDYQFDSGALIYIRSSRGYVPGGFSRSLGLTPGGTSRPEFRFKPESVIDVELGAKSEFTLGGMKGSVAADVFRSDFKDIQRAVSTVLPPGIQAQYTANAAKAKIEGFEFESTVVPFAGMRLDATYSYLQAEYTEIDPVAAPTLIGLPFANLPKHKYSVAASYTVPLAANIGSVRLSASYSYQSRFFAATAIQPLDHIESYDLVNCALDWDGVLGSSIDASVFVANATDEEYRIGQSSNYFSDGKVVSLFGEPRTYGVRLRYRFGQE